MESNCNNCNSMNCARGNMRGCSGQIAGNNQARQNRERIAQQRRREERMEQHRKEECIEQQRRREEYMGQHRREARIEQCGRVNNPSNRDNRNCNRSVEVECVCQVTCDKDCHRHDHMEQLGCEFPVVMSYVPWQQWGDMYEPECGLMQGTIFKDLNFIFCGERC